MLNLEEYWEGIRPVSNSNSLPLDTLAPLVDWADKVCVDRRYPKVFALRGANRHQILNDWLRREGLLDEPGVGVDFNGRAGASILGAWLNTWVPPEVCRKVLRTPSVSMMVGLMQVPDLRRPDGFSGYVPMKVFEDLVHLRTSRWLLPQGVSPDVAHTALRWYNRLDETQVVTALATLAQFNGLVTKAILTLDSTVEVVESDWVHVPVAFLTI